MTSRILCWTMLAVLTCATTANAQLILNEGNAVGPSGQWVDSDLSKPYEGFDYGVVPHSGNINSPLDPQNPGNPFPDVDAAEPNVQTELPNGWDSTTGWARISENGNDWIELVITEDLVDLRGYWLFWENDDDGNGVIGQNDGERGYVRFTNDPVWANLRAGTIITISEKNAAEEIRDGFPLSFPGSSIHSTGHFYDLSTDLRFDPVGVRTLADALADLYAGDWTIHFWLDESTTVSDGLDTQWFRAGSDLRVDNDDWRMYIFDSTNPNPVTDKVTGLVQDMVGESAPTWGDNTGAGGVNSQELLALVRDPVSGQTAADYEDVDFSTFGRPNLFNEATESTLDGVQDFAPLWAWLATISAGDTDFNGAVDFVDVSTTFGHLTGPDNASDVPWSLGSFDGDGDADLIDVAALQAAYSS